MGKGKRYANSTNKPKTKKKSNKILIILIISIVVIVGIIVAVLLSSKKATYTPKNPTTFIEQETEKFDKTEYVTIEDPELGEIEIQIVKGANKNNYINENFDYDENGLLSYYNNGEKASCVGIDLSSYQGEPDFEAVKNAGVDFVMLRIGGRYYSDEGKLYEDDLFQTNYAHAKAAGLKVGAYYFSQAITEDEAREEADAAIAALHGKSLDYPLAFDWEMIQDDDARTDNISNDELSNIAIAFCNEVTDKGFVPLIYSNTYLMYYKYELDKMKDYDFWVADYGEHPSMYYGFTMWQHTTKGEIDGIDGTVDLNICFKNY